MNFSLSRSPLPPSLSPSPVLLPSLCFCSRVFSFARLLLLHSHLLFAATEAMDDFDAPMAPSASGEDTRLYCLVAIPLSLSLSLPAQSPVAQQQEAKSVATALQHCTTVINTAVTAARYIWQHEPLALHVEPACSAPRSPRSAALDAVALRAAGFCGSVLAGTLDYGDNVEDAWFATHLLATMTRSLGLVAQTWDGDGQHLLIEAADALPRWVTPAASEDRALLAEGELHLVRPPVSPAELGLLPAGRCTLPQALAAVASPHVDTRAPSAVRSLLARRLGSYPALAAENMHRCRMYLPAAVLQVSLKE